MDQIASDIKATAKKAKLEVYLISKAAYFKAGGKFSEWDFRKLGGFIAIRNTYFQSEDVKDEATIVEVKETQRTYRNLQKQFGSVDLLMRRIEEAVSSMPVMKYTPYKPSKVKKKSEPRTLNLILSDLHFGSDLTVEEHSHAFGPNEEARALAGVVHNICNYKTEYRDQTELVVNILGDVIENELHGPGSSDYLHNQTCRAMWLLSQAVQRFSENFPKVRVVFCVGNHGRDTSIHPKRATDIKWNAIETTIYYGVKLSCRHLKNVEFIQPKTPWVTYKAQGHNMYVTHGDTNLNPGSVGSKIDLKNIENQVNKINASLKDHAEYKVFACGHVHHALMTVLNNGINFITNGALVPPNGFAQSMNIMESQLIQVAWETTPEHPVGDFRFINVTSRLTDKSMEKIIIPFSGINE